LTKVLVLVEGQTEETFVRDVLAKHLQAFGVYMIAVLVSTKRVKSGRKFKGGISQYGKVRHELSLLLRDRSAVAVTTMIDYYGLPRDFPGFSTLPVDSSCYQRVNHLERALAVDLGDPRLLPYLSLHEFEALLFASPGDIQSAFQGSRVEESLRPSCAPPDLRRRSTMGPPLTLRRVSGGSCRPTRSPSMARRSLLGSGLEPSARGAPTSRLGFADWRACDARRQASSGSPFPKAIPSARLLPTRPLDHRNADGKRARGRPTGREGEQEQPAAERNPFHVETPQGF
jgi:hypothetical protein